MVECFVFLRPLGLRLWGSPVATIIIPLAIVVNLVMIFTKTTKTMDIDLWNYWHFGAAAATVYVLTNGNWWLSIAAEVGS